MTTTKQLQLLATTALCSVSAWVATPALAQSQPQGASEVEEVIVTATRREEALKDVPVAITALTRQEVQNERIFDYKDAVLRVPGATFIPIKGSTYATPQIRGQMASNESPGMDAPVAVFQDDIYYGSTASFNSDFYDIAQVAVLKGPQGTTFGRNVVGGLLQVTSQKPEMGDTNAEVGVGIGNYGLLSTQGFVNAELGENTAGRASFSVRKRDGYIHNRFTGVDVDDENVMSGRIQLRHRPTDNIDALLLVQATYQNNIGDGDRLVGPSNVRGVALQNRYAPDNHDVYLDDNGENKRQLWAAIGRVDWDMNLGTVSSITGFHSLHGLYDSDVDVTPAELFGGRSYAGNVNQERLYSQEFRLVSPSGRRFEYIVGLYGEMQHLFKIIELSFNGPNVVGVGGCNPVTNPTGNYFFNCLQPAFGAAANKASAQQSLDVHSIAPYAELRWNITDQVSATIGGRYSYISKEGVTRHVGASPFYGAPYDAPFQESWTAFTPRASINWKPTDDIMLYVSRSEGFKSGGFSAVMNTAAQARVPLKPEESVSYEAGMKGYLFDRMLSLDIAAYKANTTDLQVRTLVTGVFMETNAGEAEAKGVEVDASLRPFKGLTLGARYAYTDAKYKSFTNCTAGGVDCSGNPLPFTPKNDLLLTAEYEWPALDGMFTVSGSVKYADAYTVNAIPTEARYIVPLTEQDGIVNAFLRYEPSDAAWQVQLWGKNLTDKDYAPWGANYWFMTMTNDEVAAPTTPGCTTCKGIPRDIGRAHFAPPRTFGLTFTYRFR